MLYFVPMRLVPPRERQLVATSDSMARLLGPRLTAVQPTALRALSPAVPAVEWPWEFTTSEPLMPKVPLCVTPTESFTTVAFRPMVVWDSPRQPIINSLVMPLFRQSMVELSRTVEAVNPVLPEVCTWQDSIVVVVPRSKRMPAVLQPEICTRETRTLAMVPPRSKIP